MAIAIPSIITVARNMRGELEAEHDFNMTEPGRVLRIHTSKGSRGLTTYAQCGIVGTYPGSQMQSFKMDMFGDFRKTVLQTNARATEKAIATQHREAIATVEALMLTAEAYYVTNPTKGAKLDGDIDARTFG